MKSLTLLTLLVLCLNAFAQEAGKKTCRILFHERPADAPAKLQLFDGSTSREVELPHMNFSPVYELPAGMLTLTLLPSPPQDAENVPSGAPSTNVPENVSDFYLIVSSDPNNKIAPVQIKVIDASRSNFKNGQILWCNLTDLTIRGELGSEKIEINPQSNIIMNSPTNGNDDYPVSIGYLKKENGQLHTICETRWTHNSNSRSMGFLYMPAEGLRNPRVQLYPDYRIEPQSE